MKNISVEPQFYIICYNPNWNCPKIQLRSRFLYRGENQEVESKIISGFECLQLFLTFLIDWLQDGRLDFCPEEKDANKNQTEVSFCENRSF